MKGIRTRGHAAAIDAIGAMIRVRPPHAVLLVGPSGVGKTTLATDLAAGLLCTAADPTDRPCGSCRSCRLVASGGHPDVHPLRPEGPGRQVIIGGPGSKARGIRDLIAELALMPVEGGARVAIVESAHRMNEDAQAALLKTLEEPPAGVILILCADAEEPLLPTIRSRCARLRLGPVGPRAIETILAEHGIDDPALATRLARIADGRPGRALAWAAEPEALRLRDELSRTFLDLTAARPAERLAAIRSAVARTGAIADVIDRRPGATEGAALPAPASRGRRRGSPATAGPTATATSLGEDPSAAAADAAAVPAEGSIAGDDAAALGDAPSATRAPAAERRRAADALVAVWTDVARDLLLARHASNASLRDTRLMEELTEVGGALGDADLTAFLDRLGRASVLLAANVAPELILDDLALAWPRRSVAA